MGQRRNGQNEILSPRRKGGREADGEGRAQRTCAETGWRRGTAVRGPGSQRLSRTRWKVYGLTETGRNPLPPFTPQWVPSGPLPKGWNANPNTTAAW